MTFSPFVPPTSLSSLPSGIWSGTAGLNVLPYLPGQNINFTKSPLWNPVVKRSASGRERRTSLWPYPLWQFELSYEVLRHRPTNAELFKLWEFFNLAGGQFGAWLFVDPTDNAVTAAPFGTGDGATTTFQMTRPVNSWSEPVYAVYSPTIYVNGSSTGAVTYASNGQVTFTSAPAAAAALTWTGYFYFGCRFLDPDMAFEQIVPALWSGKALKFTSLRA